EIDVTALTVPELSFWTISHNNDGSVSPFNEMYVEASDGLGGWTQVGLITGETGPGWVQNLFVISGFTYGANLVQLRFRMESGGDVQDYNNDMPLDDVEVREAPTCPQPSGLVVSNVLGTSADITWTDNAGASEWEVEYGPTGYTPGTGTSVLVSTTSTTLTGMMNSTDYQICVRAVCSPGDSSFWSCTPTFATACGTFPAPFIESFEVPGMPNCWTPGGQTPWEYGSAATTPTGFAFYGAQQAPDYSVSGTGTFIGMDGSDNTTGEVSTLLTPFIDATTLTLPMVSYAVFYNNVNDATLNELLVEFWDGAAWTTLNTVQQNQGPNWVEYTSIIDPITITGDVQVRFTVTGGTGTPFYNDILIDDVEVKEAPPCPNPNGLTWTGGDDTSAALTWNAGYQETMWILEYGPIGFVPGSGTQVPAPQNPDTLTGLNPNEFYDVYVYADCGGDTSQAVGPASFNTYNQGQFMEVNTLCPDTGWVDIASVGVLNTLGDDGEVSITLPFPVFYHTIGTAPNQIFIVQWNKDHLGGNTNSYIFQLQIHQATSEIYFVYDDIEVGNVGIDFGASATIGAAGPNSDVQVSFNDPQYLTDETCVNFYYTNCARPINYAVSYTTTSEGAITWNAGPSNETDWQVIYGQQGFDPMTGGTSVTINGGSALIIPGLDDMTTYDVYILALCANGDTSVALTGDFTTLPDCADPTGLAGATAVDSIFTAWNYTANTGFDIQEFAMEYGPTGYTSGGTYITGIDTINTTDTLFDATLMSGGLYDVYIQAICLTGDSSNLVGPITVTMPLTNDSTCLAQALPVDGVNYSFNGTGATAAAGELAIAPPAGPCDGQMTWCNSSVTASTWYTFVAPASGNVRIDGEFQAFDGQVAVYETSDCADFNQYNLVGANDDFNTTGDDFVYLNLCGLTPGNTYYLMHDPNGAAGVYSLRLQEIVVEAGTDNGQLDVCLGGIVDLSTQLSGADAGGTWSEDIPTAGFNDPIWSSAGLASQVYTFEYVVVDGCAVDSVMTSVEVFSPSFAGNDGTIDACMNEPIDLLQGLVGGVNVSFTGTWYDPSANALPTSAINANSIPGQYNYEYIAGNGVCPDDSATVTVTVDPNCDYLNLQDLTFGGMDIYPNPTTNVFYISNEGSTEVYNYELTDLNGKVIATKEAAITGVETTEVNVEKLETGVYLIRIFNENAEKTFRVVKQ
ncbi:fibronectin type III domain-containing protein, partial [Crocinitomicaceae bacterium]|nr:fibronectin type III domain-containing protein [Crocinitomicaceae bacterium]